MQRKSSRAYERFLKAKLSLPEEPKTKAQPQETVEKMIQSLKKQQGILQKTLDDCIRMSEESSDKDNNQSDFAEYHIEKLLMQLSDQIAKLERELTSDMDKVGENIYNNLSQSNDNVEKSCKTIEKEVLGIHRTLGEQADEYNQKITVLQDSIENNLKEYIDDRMKETAKQELLQKVEKRMPVLLILGIINIAGIILNILLLFIR